MPPWAHMFLPSYHHGLVPEFTLFFRTEFPMHFHCCPPQLQSPKLPFWEQHLWGGSEKPPPYNSQRRTHCAPSDGSTDGHIQVLSGQASCQKQTCQEVETKHRAIGLMSISLSQRDCGSGRGIPEVAAAEAEASPS